MLTIERLDKRIDVWSDAEVMKLLAASYRGKTKRIKERIRYLEYILSLRGWGCDSTMCTYPEHRNTDWKYWQKLESRYLDGAT